MILADCREFSIFVFAVPGGHCPAFAVPSSALPRFYPVRCLRGCGERRREARLHEHEATKWQTVRHSIPLGAAHDFRPGLEGQREIINMNVPLGFEIKRQHETMVGAVLQRLLL